MDAWKRWPIFYYEGSVLLHEDEGPPPPLKKGDGVIWHGGSERYRVVDVWVSYDHHGRYDDGIHVFMEKVSWSDDDLPFQLASDYFTRP